MLYLQAIRKLPRKKNAQIVQRSAAITTPELLIELIHVSLGYM